MHSALCICISINLDFKQTINIFDSDLVWQIQMITIYCKIGVVCDNYV